MNRGEETGSDPELDWDGRKRRGRAFRNWVGVAMVLALVGFGWGLRHYTETHGERTTLPPVARPDPLPAGAQLLDDATVRKRLAEAAEVARSFLGAESVEDRLAFVRHREEVRERAGRYPAEARVAPGAIDSELGYAVRDGRETAAFTVILPGERYRLLELVRGREEWRVDWDAYARHGTASWEELWSGAEDRAVVRVFCEPSSEAPEPFDDREKWTGFRLSSPDMPEMALGFAEIGTVREAMMKKVLLGSPHYRQRFVLELVRHQGPNEPLFEITRCLAVGWTEEEHAVEDVWEKAARSEP